ncbi:MAG TPA: hypothetical protein VHG28_18865 [Longimicrobiaceae bacterium]|nr:hypothetical protein [Longimicrobiaceae bacterium]
MTDDAFPAIPPVPPSVAEWEDLLVRVEIAPRALRATLEDVPGDDPEVRELVARAAEREAAWQRTMEALRAGKPVEGGAPAPLRVDGRIDTEAMVEVFGSLRMRTFAMAQRRGVDVWEWVTEGPDGSRVTPFRLFTRMVREDARLLGALRERARSGGIAC